MQHLRLMLAVLPRQNSDDLAGELFVEAYCRHLGHLPDDAVRYLADQAVRQCRWFPTIAECLEIVSGWRRSDADVLRQTKARHLASGERLARMAPPEKQWQPTADELEAIKRQAASNLSARNP